MVTEWDHKGLLCVTPQGCMKARNAAPPPSRPCMVPAAVVAKGSWSVPTVGSKRHIQWGRMMLYGAEDVLQTIEDACAVCVVTALPANIHQASNSNLCALHTNGSYLILSGTAQNLYPCCCPAWKTKSCSPALYFSPLCGSQCLLPSAASPLQHWQQLQWEQKKKLIVLLSLRNSTKIKD